MRPVSHRQNELGSDHSPGRPGSHLDWKDKENIIDQVVTGQVSSSRKVQAGAQGPGRQGEHKI